MRIWQVKYDDYDGSELGELFLSEEAAKSYVIGEYAKHNPKYPEGYQFVQFGNCTGEINLQDENGNHECTLYMRETRD